MNVCFQSNYCLFFHRGISFLLFYSVHLVQVVSVDKFFAVINIFSKISIKQKYSVCLKRVSRKFVEDPKVFAMPI